MFEQWPWRPAVWVIKFMDCGFVITTLSGSNPPPPPCYLSSLCMLFLLFDTCLLPVIVANENVVKQLQYRPVSNHHQSRQQRLHTKSVAACVVDDDNDGNQHGKRPWIIIAAAADLEMGPSHPLPSPSLMNRQAQPLPLS